MCISLSLSIYIYICKCICILICICICICICMYVCIYIHTYLYLYLYLSLYMYMYIYIYIDVCCRVHETQQLSALASGFIWSETFVGCAHPHPRFGRGDRHGMPVSPFFLLFNVYCCFIVRFFSVFCCSFGSPRLACSTRTRPSETCGPRPRTICQGASSRRLLLVYTTTTNNNNNTNDNNNNNNNNSNTSKTCLRPSARLLLSRPARLVYEASQRVPPTTPSSTPWLFVVVLLFSFN